MLDRLTIERAVAASGDRPLVIALSGGGDSTALLHLMTEAIGASGLHAVVVDHALREGSAADARRAADFAEALNIPAEIVKLQWGATSNRAQQAARSMRYAALCEAARAIDARVVVTGHTRDDQAETVLLRAERASGWRGLAGMRAFAPLPLWPDARGLWMARPLLGARRAELRDYLTKRGVEWIDDPANTNTVYARVRARSTLAALEGQGLDPMRLAALAERLAPRAEALDAAARALIARAATFDGDTIAIDRAAWRAAAPVRQRALAVSLAAAGGAERAPGDDQTAALDAQMLGDGFRGATLSGAVVSVSRSGWRLTRDAGALAGRADGARPLAPLKLTPSAQTVWDRRLALHATAPGWSVIVENGAPVLSNGDARAGIGEAGPKWLLAERVSHLLGSAN